MCSYVIARYNTVVKQRIPIVKDVFTKYEYEHFTTK